MGKEHHYKVEITWLGNRGTGTSGYKEYERDHVIRMEGKADIQGSSDSAFRGDITKHNPEDFLVTALSQCHMLWYLHLCADAGIIVTEYKDNATGIMEEDAVKGGSFKSVTLHPMVTITDPAKIEKANSLHHEANRKCFISNSVNFKVDHVPQCVVK